jgi:hypothetical protein
VLLTGRAAVMLDASAAGTLRRPPSITAEGEPQ